MRIQHNIAAINNYRSQQQLGKVVSGSMEKLSSGKRINRAADDAAGLVISEKMRAQMRGLSQAERNIQDGISMLQTADAGLGEIADPNLVRLRELAIQAATDTLTDMERGIIQLEVNQILASINDIANQTHFNTRPLLNHDVANNSIAGLVDGKFDYKGVLAEPPVSLNGRFQFKTNQGYPTTNADQNQMLVFGQGGTSYPAVIIDGKSYALHNFTQMNDGRAELSESTKKVGNSYETKFKITIPVEKKNDNGTTVIKDVNLEVVQSISIDKDKYHISYGVKHDFDDELNVGFLFHLDTKLGQDDNAPFIKEGVPLTTQMKFEEENIPDSLGVYNSSTGVGVNAEFKAEAVFKWDGMDNPPSSVAVGPYYSVSDPNFNPKQGAPIGDSGYQVQWSEKKVSHDKTLTFETKYGQSIPDNIIDPNEDLLWFHKRGEEKVVLQTGANSGQTLEVKLTDATTQGLNLHTLNLSTRESAETSLALIDQAIATISSERGRFGALTNVLEHTATHVANYRENLTSTLSKLEDVEVAEAVANLQAEQVILQAAQSMGAQANQQLQGILQLLQ